MANLYSFELLPSSSVDRDMLGDALVYGSVDPQGYVWGVLLYTQGFIETTFTTQVGIVF